MRIPAVGISILPSQLIYSLLRLTPAIDNLCSPSSSLAGSPACHDPDLPRVPSEAAPGRVSLPEHQHVIPGRKTMLGTAGDQVYKPGPVMWGGAGRRAGERAEKGQGYLSSPRVLGIPASPLTNCVSWAHNLISLSLQCLIK